jgi:beta-mannosidase
MGAQPLYTVAVNLIHGGRAIGFPPFTVGLRQIRLDTSRQEDQRRRFRLVVNGVPMFCKGADWIPADSIYARVTPEKYAALIRQAQLAHINMLRIWGGGLYEQEAFTKPATTPAS